MSLATTRHWKTLDAQGRPVALFRRRKVDGIITIQMYTYRGAWEDAQDYFFTVIEDPAYLEITAGEAADLMPLVRERQPQ